MRTAHQTLIYASQLAVHRVETAVAHEHDEGDHDNADDSSLSLRIVAVFVILAAGLVGALPPLFMKVGGICDSWGLMNHAQGMGTDLHACQLCAACWCRHSLPTTPHQHHARLSTVLQPCLPKPLLGVSLPVLPGWGCSSYLSSVWILIQLTSSWSPA